MSMVAPGVQPVAAAAAAAYTDTLPYRGAAHVDFLAQGLEYSIVEM